MTQWGLDTLFNPAKRHMDEEKRRLQSTRTEVGDNSGGKRIDLESGKVVIRRADDESDDAAGDGSGNGGTPSTGEKSSAGKSARSGKPAKNEKSSPDTKASRGAKASKGGQPAKEPTEPSAAAIRAAKRRGREPR